MGELKGGFTTRTKRLGVRYAHPLPYDNSEEKQHVIGSLLFADPSAAEFPRHIHTFDPLEYHSNNQEPADYPEIRTVTARETTYWDPKRAARDAAELEGNAEDKIPNRFGFRGRA